MSSPDDQLRDLVEGSTPAKPRRKKATRRKKAQGPSVDLGTLDLMSESELVAVARLAGYPTASRQLLREDLISLILGELDQEPVDPLEGIRATIYEFVDGNQRILRSQMSCDLYCPACPHNKVVECYTVNRDKVG